MSPLYNETERQQELIRSVEPPRNTQPPEQQVISLLTVQQQTLEHQDISLLAAHCPICASFSSSYKFGSRFWALHVAISPIHIHLSMSSSLTSFLLAPLRCAAAVHERGLARRAVGAADDNCVAWLLLLSRGITADVGTQGLARGMNAAFARSLYLCTRLRAPILSPSIES